MTPVRRTAIGTIVMVIGILWFLFDLMWLPPALMIFLPLCSLNPTCQSWLDISGRILLQTEFLVSALIVAAGVFLRRRATGVEPVTALRRE
jgi:hypothetical protein